MPGPPELPVLPTSLRALALWSGEDEDLDEAEKSEAASGAEAPLKNCLCHWQTQFHRHCRHTRQLPRRCGRRPNELLVMKRDYW